MATIIVDPVFSTMPKSQIPGVIAITIFAIVSTLALISVAIRVVWLAARRYWFDNAAQPHEYVFFNTQLGHYAVCLLVANLLSSVAGLIGISWIVQKGIPAGIICLTQATLMQAGNWATAYFTITIGVHTFNSLVRQKRQSVLACAAAIVFGWILATLMAIVPLIVKQSFGPVYGVNGVSCGVRAIYPKAEFFMHLLPIFIASVLSAVGYSIVFLVLRGTLVIKGGLKLTLDPNERWTRSGVGQNYHRFVASIARSMLWFPIAYIVLLVPYSVMRLLDISGFRVPFAGMVIAYLCWYLLGVVNVALLYNTFRVLGPAFDRSVGGSGPTINDMESFGTTEVFKQYPSPLSPSSRVMLGEKIDNYRLGGHARDQSVDTASTFSGNSSRNLLPARQDQRLAASVQSYYSYPVSPPVGRQTFATTNDKRRQSIITAPPRSLQQRPTVTIDHSRQTSVDSVGLPAAPRSSRSPITRYPTMEDLNDPTKRVQGVWTNLDRNQSGTSALSRQQSGASRRDSTTMSSSYGSDRSLAVTPPGNGRAMLSAVRSAFNPPSPRATDVPPPLPVNWSRRHSRSMTAATTGRQRTLLGPRAGSVTGSSVADYRT